MRFEATAMHETWIRKAGCGLRDPDDILQQARNMVFGKERGREGMRLGKMVLVPG